MGPGTEEAVRKRDATNERKGGSQLRELSWRKRGRERERERERERRLTSPNIIVHDRDPIENLSKSRNVRHRVSVRSSEGPDLLQRNTRNTTSSREEKSASCKKEVARKT